MNNKHTWIFGVSWLLLLFVAATVRAAAPVTPDKVSLAVRKAVAGDTIVIANGTYRDVKLTVQGDGERDQPIVVRAETPGEVHLEGESNLRIAGNWLVVSGLWFRNGSSPSGTVVEYRQGSRHAFDCRVTQCVIEAFNPESRQTKGNWVQLYGRNNRFDHCSVVGKLNEGVAVAVVLDHADNQNHRIDNNYFGPRPVYGSNGAETIRTGNSFTANTSSFLVIEDNYFDRCSGEVEAISVKSSDNTIRRNTFFECQGGIALRHGDRNTVELNLMIGSGKPNTGGIRVVNEGHCIRNNYFRGLVGRRAFAPLAIMNGVPNSPDYRYRQVVGVEINNNTFDSCSNILFCLGRDFERTEPPREVIFSENLIVAPRDSAVYAAFDDISGIAFENNRTTIENLPAGFVPAKKVGRSAQGFAYDDAPMARMKPSDTCDITGKTVRTKNFTGALDRVNAKRLFATASKECVGAGWYVYVEPSPRKLSGRVVNVAAGRNTLLDAVAGSQPGDVISLTEEGQYWNDASVIVTHYLRIIAAEGLKTKPLLRYAGRGKEPLITIGNGGHLDLQGVAFNGIPEKELCDPKGFVGTAMTMIEDYTLNVLDCEFSCFNRSGTYAISCSPGSFSPQITIRDSQFVDLPWDAVVLSRETDFYGRYNVDNLLISNCLFANIGGRGIDLARYGYDESTSGPHARIEHCTFFNVFNREQGSVIDLSGVQCVWVEDCVFERSGQGGACIRLNEMRWDDIEITRCNFYDAGRIHSFWNTGVKDDMLHFKPLYADPLNNDFRQRSDSPLAVRATDGMNVGIN